MKTPVILLPALFAASACGKSAPRPVPPTPAPAPATEASPGPEDEGAEDVGSAAKVPADLPPFGHASGEDAGHATAILDELAGDVAQGMVDDETIARVVEAVRAAPGLGRARVMLALLVDDEAFRVAQLEPLTTATDCADCADALLNLDDEQWPESVQAIKARVIPSKQRAAADAINAFVRSGQGSIAGYFKGKQVVLEWNCMTCELAGEGTAAKPKKLTGKQALAWIVAGQKATTAEEDERDGSALYPMTDWYCSGDCCTSHEAFYGEPNGHSFLEGLCFAPGTDQVTRIQALD